ERQLRDRRSARRADHRLPGHRRSRADRGGGRRPGRRDAYVGYPPGRGAAPVSLPSIDGGSSKDMDLSRVEWRTSSYSTGNGGDCVEVGAGPQLVAVRDSKDRNGPALVFSKDEWAAFLGCVKEGSPGLA